MVTSLKECISPNFYDLHKAIRAGENSEYWLRGGRGSCKSSFSSIEIALGILNDRDANAVIFRKFENEIRDSVYAQMLWALEKLGVDHLFKCTTSPYRITYKATGQMIIFKGADNPKKIKSIKLAQGYLKYAWFEEVDQFGGMRDIRNILQSAFRGTTKQQIAFYSYNPPKSARSWANAETKKEKPGRVVHFSDYRAVPKDWLGPTFLMNAEYCRETTPDTYNHEYLGEEIGTGLEVFNNVTTRAITDDEIEQFDNCCQGLDFGFGPDPLSFGQMYYNVNHRKLYIFFEISGHGIKNRVFVDMLSEEQRTNITLADKAEPKSIAEMKDDYGMNIVGAVKGPGSIEHGIKWLQDLEEIIIDPVRCPLHAKEFVNYALKLNQQEEVIARFPDKDNHTIDETRYACSLLITQARLEKQRSKFKAKPIPVSSRWGR